MGFLDKAKQAAADMQQKADLAMSNAGLMGGTPGAGGMGSGMGGGAGQADRLLRDLGVLTYLNAVGRPGSGADYQRIMGELQGLESTGRLNLSLTSATPAYGAPGAPPPPPGAARAAYEASQAAASAPPAPGSAPPPPSFAPPPPPAGPAAPESQPEVGGGQGTGAPPPPPSWS